MPLMTCERKMKINSLSSQPLFVYVDKLAMTGGMSRWAWGKIFSLPYLEEEIWGKRRTEIVVFEEIPKKKVFK